MAKTGDNLEVGVFDEKSASDLDHVEQNHPFETTLTATEQKKIM